MFAAVLGDFKSRHIKMRARGRARNDVLGPGDFFYLTLLTQFCADLIPALSPVLMKALVARIFGQFWSCLHDEIQ